MHSTQESYGQQGSVADADAAWRFVEGKKKRKSIKEALVRIWTGRKKKREKEGLLG